MRLRLYLGQRQSEAVQTYESLALIVSQAFGNGKKGGATKPENRKVARTKDEMVAGMQEIFGKNGA